MAVVCTYTYLEVDCESCHELTFNECSEIVLPPQLSSLTNYCVEIIDKFGNVYKKIIQTSSFGFLTLNELGLPKKFFNKYSGDIEVRVKVNCNDTNYVPLTISGLTKECIILNIYADESITPTTVTPVISNMVVIYNQDGVIIDVVDCGGNYTVTQWAGIDEGSSTTTYTDGITDE